MGASFYFFDLETSGFSHSDDRIMQFAGQRTDMDLKPLGKPDNILIKMTPDILPQPDAVLVHGITPQRTLKDGISEAEFCKYLTSQVFIDNTIMVGYNNARFDNGFIRFILWRNFYDAYEWSWKNGCSIWDLLDVVRMTRALRPEGIEWPFAPDGRPTNSLEYLTAVNKIEHDDAHDALSDVNAVIALAKLLKDKQPKMFDYLLNIRGKKQVAPFVNNDQPFVYTSGRYPSEYSKTAIVAAIAENKDKSGALVYDLRIDPDEFSGLHPAELARRWSARGEDEPYFPVKELKYNKCPAVAPLDVLEKSSCYERLQLHKAVIDNHYEKLKKARGFAPTLMEALDIIRPKTQGSLMDDPLTVDGQLYDRFVPDEDKMRLSAARASEPSELRKFADGFKDGRLNLLLPLYMARNHPNVLSADEKQQWEQYRQRKHSGSAANRYYARLDELEATPGISIENKFLLAELRDYGRSVIPIGLQSSLL